jgi:hypothetical protein
VVKRVKRGGFHGAKLCPKFSLRVSPLAITGMSRGGLYLC